MAIDSIPARILSQAKKRPERPAYFVRKNGSWRSTTWRDYVGEVRMAARAMIALGLQSGDTACILGFNSPEWTVFDVACMAVGGAPAGIYTTCSPEEVSYIVNHAESRLILLEDEGQWAKIESERAAGKLENLSHVVLLKGSVDDEMVMTWDQFMAKGEETDAGEVDTRIDALEEAQLATLIYTSGTTGPPKGVMLSHKNLAWTSKVAAEMVGTNERDTGLSYLPLSHIAEQMFTVHVPATAGSSVYYAESIDKVPDNLKEVQPTVFFGVPRIWEKFHAGVSGKMALAEGVKKKLVTWAMGVGRKVSDLRNRGQEPTGLLAVQYRMADKLIFSKVKPAVGLGNARFCVTGAAPISREILEFFSGLDLTVLEVYGQSEDTGPTSFNLPGKTRFGTVGQPIPGTEVKIADDGEILAKGPHVFLGYYKDQEATDATLKDGWLYSGDLGRIDADGYLHITGRKKEIIITAGGKNITPKNIESALKNDPLITEAVVIGDRRKFLSAIVCFDPDAAEAFAKKHGIAVDDVVTSTAAKNHVQAHIDSEVNPKFARVEQIKKFTILPRPLDVEHGELTPTLKVKRRIVNEVWADEIEAMYAD